MFLRQEEESFLLVYLGSGAKFFPAFQKGFDLGCCGVLRILPDPKVEKLKFACESVIQIKIDSEIAEVLLLFEGENRLDLRLSERIVTIQCLLPDIYSQERSRRQDRLR